VIKINAIGFLFLARGVTASLWDAALSGLGCAAPKGRAILTMGKAHRIKAKNSAKPRKGEIEMNATGFLFLARGVTASLWNYALSGLGFAAPKGRAILTMGKAHRMKAY
jgi:hypothetical protein